MNSDDFIFLAAFLRRRSGLSVGLGKKHLIENRLKPVASRHGFKSVADLVAALRTAGEPLETAVTEAMMTSDSCFFRDGAPLSRFRDTILPALLQARGTTRPLRIWCAGCAAGQEPYSLAMMLDGMEQLTGRTVEIVATDVSAAAIARAREGIFTHFEVMRGLPIQMLSRYFHAEGDDWRICEAMRARVNFRQENLLGGYGESGVFDVIFCRNVLIYFDSGTKQDVVRRLADALADDGYLVLGAQETVMGLTQRWEPMGADGLHVKTPQLLTSRTAAAR